MNKTKVLSYIHITKCFATVSKLQESLLPLLLPFFVIHMGDVYLIYQGARPTDIIKITALTFWPKYVYEADKRPFIYDGICIKRPVIVFVRRLTTL